MNQERNVSLDNAKGLLIILVVFAHVIESIATTATFVSVIHAIIYSFHMPAFVFVSGYFSKNDERTYKNAVVSCLIPFLVLNIVYSILKKNINIFIPGPTLWYFLCLFYWRIFTGSLKRVRFLMLISVIMALFVGFIQNVNSFMGISRAICFYPFFLLGYFCDQEHIKKLNMLPKWCFGLIFIFTILFSIVLKIYFFPNLSYALKDPYNMSQYLGFSDFIKRLILLCVFFSGTVSFLVIIETYSKNGVLAQLGQRTVSVYALHIFFIHGVLKLMKKMLSVTFETFSGEVIIAISLLMTIVIVYVLGNKFVFDYYNYVMGKISGLVIKE